jgi:hypothetical protein
MRFVKCRKVPVPDDNDAVKCGDLTALRWLWRQAASPDAALPEKEGVGAGGPTPRKTVMENSIDRKKFDSGSLNLIIVKCVS